MKNIALFLTMTAMSISNNIKAPNLSNVQMNDAVENISYNIELERISDSISKDSVCLFNKAVKLIKESEGWHDASHYPYVGYGHKLLKGDDFDHNISESFAEKILIKDLISKMDHFKELPYRKRLLMGLISYNIGEFKIKNSSAYKLISKQETINLKELKEKYIVWNMWNGKRIASIKRRRIREFNLIFYDA